MTNHNKESIKDLPIEKLVDLLTYMYETNKHKDLTNAEFIGNIKQEIIQRTK